MNRPYSFGQWLKQRRRQLGLTQVELAECAGCTAATIRKIEAEERRPSRQIAELLAGCLNVPADQLPIFLQVARGERRAERLGSVPATSDPELTLDYLVRPPTSHLPLPTTPFLGRAEEVAAVTHLIRDPHCRLLTLVGPGGIGKTRLVLQAATQLQTEFDHGATFVSLAAMTGREQAVTSIADALGFVLYGATDRSEQLFHYLREKVLLLVLDNVEHLLVDPACVALFVDILRGAPEVKLLVTSREPIQLQVEWVYDVPGLPIPASPELDVLASNSATQLFLQRAQRARAGFTLTAEDGPAVMRICQLVGGLPLGLELAAGWAPTLSCPEIAQELERDLEDPARGMTFLVSAARDIPDRHRSIGAVFEHSWQLLSVEEQQVLRRLAVFQGGFSREAVEFIAGATLSMLSALMAKSLLRRTDATTGRYDLHDLVRQYALGYLQQNNEEYLQTRNRHCRYYTALLARRGTALKGTERAAVVAELISEVANLRLAWNWAVTHKQALALSQAADTLFWLYESRSNCREGVPLFGQAVESLQIVATSGHVACGKDDAYRRLALAQTLSYQGFFCFRQGMHPQGKALLQSSLALAETLKDDGGIEVQTALSDATAFLGTVTAVMGDFQEGHCLLREGLAMKRALDDRWGAAFCLRQLGLSAFHHGDYSEAYRLLDESLVLGRDMGNTWAIASALNLISLAAYAQGSYYEAQRFLQEGLALSRAIEDRYNIAVGLNSLGLVNQAMSRESEAQHCFERSIAIWREIGDHGDLAQTLNNLGGLLLAKGNQTEAEQLYREALAVAQAAEVAPVALDAFLGLASMQTPIIAVPLLDQILGHPAATQGTRERAETARAEAASRLSPSQVTDVSTQAQVMSFETAVSDILNGSVGKEQARRRE